MTALEQAHQFLDEIKRRFLLILYVDAQDQVALALARLFDEREQAAYERGVTDGQVLAALNQQTKGD